MEESAFQTPAVVSHAVEIQIEGVSPLASLDSKPDEDKENLAGPSNKPRLFLKSDYDDRQRVSVLDGDPLALDLRKKIDTLVLASCTDDENNDDDSRSDNICLDVGDNTVFVTPAYVMSGHLAAGVDENRRLRGSDNASPALVAASINSAPSGRSPLKARVNEGNVGMETASSSTSTASLRAKIPDRHVARLPFSVSEEDPSRTPFSGFRSTNVS